MTNITQELKDRIAAKKRELQERLVELRALASAEADDAVVRLNRKLAKLDAYVARTGAEETTGSGRAGARP